jgi:hypothetical protein
MSNVHQQDGENAAKVTGEIERSLGQLPDTTSLSNEIPDLWHVDIKVVDISWEPKSSGDQKLTSVMTIDQFTCRIESHILIAGEPYHLYTDNGKPFGALLGSTNLPE